MKFCRVWRVSPTFVQLLFAGTLSKYRWSSPYAQRYYVRKDKRSLITVSYRASEWMRFRKKREKKGNNKVQTFIDKGGCRKFAWKSLVGRVTPETGIVNNYEWLKRLWISRMLKYCYLLTSCSEINRRTGAKRRSNWRPLQCSVASQCSACHFPILPLPLACLVNCAVWYYGILLWGSYFYEACCFLLWSRF